MSDLGIVQTRFEQALLLRDRITIKTLLQQLYDQHPVMYIIDTFLSPVLERIGIAWEEGKVALAQLYMIGRLCEDVIESLFPVSETRRSNGLNLGIAVLQDHHTLGKRMVRSALSISGYHVLDYGHGLEAESLIAHACQDELDMLLISTLMLPSAYRVEEVSNRLKLQNPDIKIVVGGAPFRFDTLLWQQVGADAMGASATDAIRIVGELSARR